MFFRDLSAGLMNNSLQRWQQCLSEIYLQRFFASTAILIDEVQHTLARRTMHHQEPRWKRSCELFVCFAPPVSPLATFDSGPSSCTATLIAYATVRFGHECLLRSHVSHNSKKCLLQGVEEGGIEKESVESAKRRWLRSQGLIRRSVELVTSRCREHLDST